jgi:hypothetical protein
MEMRIMRKVGKTVSILALAAALGVLAGCQPPPEDWTATGSAQPAAAVATTATATGAEGLAPLSEIARNTPGRFQLALEEPSNGWSIDARVILPENLERFDVISCEIGEAPDFKAVLESSAIPEELRQVESHETETLNFIDDTNVSGQTREVEVPEPEEGILYSLTCAPGQMDFTHTVPDEYLSNSYDFGIEILSADGIAQACELTGEEARAKALEFLNALPLSFRYDAGQVLAFSPGDKTQYVRGYYRVQIQQTIDTKPVALYNASSGGSWGVPIDSDYTPALLGGEMMVFDYGIRTAELKWLSDSYQVKRPVEKLLPLSAAAKIAADFLKNPGGPDTSGGSYFAMEKGVRINTIRLEYAATGHEGGRVILTPCWSFEGSGNMPYFYGIRIDALTGEVLFARGGV